MKLNVATGKVKVFHKTKVFSWVWQGHSAEEEVALRGRGLMKPEEVTLGWGLRPE